MLPTPSMHLTFRLLAVLALSGLPRLAQAAEPPTSAWFVPPPPGPGDTTVDMRRHGSMEDITITAPRRAAPVQADPRGEETHDFQPAHSAAATPEQGSPAQSYCHSAYQTIGGQAATGADMVGMGGGRCE